MREEAAITKAVSYGDLQNTRGFIPDQNLPVASIASYPIREVSRGRSRGWREERKKEKKDRKAATDGSDRLGGF